MSLIRRSRSNQNKENEIVVPCSGPSIFKILDVNDHCLLKIIGYLSPLDVCAVKDTCYRLRGLAEKKMKMFYEFREFVLDMKSQTSSEFRAQKKMFSKFCGVLDELKISIDKAEDSVSDHKFKIIEKINPKLRSLSLFNTNLQIAERRLRHIFPNLSVIKLRCLNTGDYPCIKLEDLIKNILKNCKNLEQLTFVGEDSCYQGIFLQQKFKRLRSLALLRLGDFDSSNLKMFFKYNPTVEEISLLHCIRLRKFSDLGLKPYATNIRCVNLSLENEHQQLPDAVNALCEMGKMFVLSLDTCGTNITNFMSQISQRNTLETLILQSLTLEVNERLAELLCSMSNLKKLSLIFSERGVPTINLDNFFRVFGKGLNDLTVLFLYRCSHITAQHIAHIIENCDNLKELRLPFSPRAIFNQEQYLSLITLRNRKNLDFPLTISFFNKLSLNKTIGIIPSNILQKHSTVIGLHSGYHSYLVFKMLSYQRALKN